MMKTLPNKKHLELAQQKKVWDFGNSILYKLCKDNFHHKSSDVIITKVLFIGRIYSAAVERRKNKSNFINDDFYIDSIAPIIKESKIDAKLSELKSIKPNRIGSIISILEAHHYLLTTFQKITDQEKRSFCSKYLHFHLPELFYIYDSRVVGALRNFISQVPKDLKYILDHDNIDKEYAKFYCKCFDVKRQIMAKYNIELTNRELDNLLIDIANKQNKAGK